MEVNMIILPKNNSDINLGMKKQIKQLFENLFNNVNDSSFEINLDNNVKIEYKISSKEKNMVFLKLSCKETPARAAKYLDSVTNRLIQGEHRKTWNIVISYDGCLVGVKDDFYDFLIRRELPEGEIIQARLIGNLLLKYPLGISDSWYMNRIKHMIETGEIKVVKEADEIFRRSIRKEQ